MNKFLMIMLVAVLGVGVASHAAEEGKKKGKGDPEAVFKKKDKNGDGKLSFEEFKGNAPAEKAAGLEKKFKAMDKNANGSIELEEFKLGGGKGKKKAE